jgi:uncharacterized protein
VLLCDTGVLLAAGNVKDHAHPACLRLLRQADGPLLVPSPVLGEIGYLLQSRVGPQAEVTFLKSFGDDGFHIAELEEHDIQRTAELVETYIDLPLGIVDAAVIAIAERLQLTEIATLDHRHFTVVRPRHTSAFVLLPASDTA